MAPINIFDSLELTAERAGTTSVVLTCDGDDLPRDDRNLAVRAARLFLARIDLPHAVSIRLVKRIPAGAGLGGGSSDAAAVLRGLDRLVDAHIDVATLGRWGMDLGADVPFFVNGRPARVQGIGEVVDGLETWPDWALVVVFPGVNLSTAEVYRAYDRSLTKPAGASTIPVSVVGEAPFRELLVNDLEAAAIQIFPPLMTLQQRLVDWGALKTSMTGSGSAMFGVWPGRVQAQVAAARLQGEGLWAHAVEILSRTPELVEG